MTTPPNPPPGPPQGWQQGPPPSPPPGRQGPPPSGSAPAGPPGQQQGQPHGAGPGAEKPKRPISIGQILGGILLVLVVVFIFENTNRVQVRLIVPQYRMPVALPIVIAAVLGALIAWLLRYRRQRHHSSRAGRSGDQNKQPPRS